MKTDRNAKIVWIKADPWNKELVKTAIETGADAIIVPDGKESDVKALGLINTVSNQGDIQWDKDVVYADVKSTEDEREIVTLTQHKKVIVRTTDWTIIPLENLVAQTSNIFVEVDNIEDAKTAMGILEKGVDGIIINQKDPIKAREIVKMTKTSNQSVDMVILTVDRIIPLGMGDRVCVDTCSMMDAGEGCLIGNSSRALFMVHAESITNPYVAPRPFRVNAGPVHAYIMVPGNKTKYLSELQAGDEVVCVNAKGLSKNLIVGRIKIEQRPLLMVEAIGPHGKVNTILQNAETIRLVDTNGEAISVVKLKPGDEIMGFVEEAGRHFGHKIKETITEK